MDFVIVLYLCVKRRDFLLEKIVILAVDRRYKSANEILHGIIVKASNALPSQSLIFTCDKFI